MDRYGFKGYVQSDCGAVSNEVGGEKYAANKTDAAAKAIVDGHMNSCCGGGRFLSSRSIQLFACTSLWLSFNV